MAEEKKLYFICQNGGTEGAADQAPFAIVPITLATAFKIRHWMECFKEGHPLHDAEEVSLYDTSAYFITGSSFDDFPEEEDVSEFAPAAIGREPHTLSMLTSTDLDTIIVDRLPKSVESQLETSEFDGGIHIRTEMDRLQVTGDSAYWRSGIKHTDCYIETSILTKSDVIRLCEWLTILNP